MSRTTKDYIVLALKGMGMGAADVVPGVSGGTIAFISGIYQELIESISNFNIALIKVLFTEGISAFWKKANLSFLVPLMAGIFISVFSVMRLMHYLLTEHPVPLWAFFWGLILASTWFISKQVKDWNWKNILLFALGASIAFGITLLNTTSGNSSLGFLFMAGALASCAMILPGISGSFILVLLGAYSAISEAVHNFEIKKIAAVGLGAAVGILSFSKFLKWLFKNYEKPTLALLGGFVFGSLNKIWPWKKVLATTIVKDKVVPIKEISIWPTQFDGDPQILLAITMAILGVLVILLLEKVAPKNN